jgi:hypothetical protein
VLATDLEPVSRQPRITEDGGRVLRIGHCRDPRPVRGSGSIAALGSSQPLSEIVFEETENGCPYLSELPDLWFSFSSCRFGILGAWSSSHGIGVDVEDPSRDLEVEELAR